MCQLFHFAGFCNPLQKKNVSNFSGIEGDSKHLFKSVSFHSCRYISLCIKRLLNLLVDIVHLTGSYFTKIWNTNAAVLICLFRGKHLYFVDFHYDWDEISIASVIRFQAKICFSDKTWVSSPSALECVWVHT